MSDSPPPPTWVVKRDGARAPFEADKISRALFAASESLGAADAFLARELADGVVYFLAEEGADEVPTSQVAEVVAKVVRELGHPLLAEAFADHGRRRIRNSTPPSPTQPTAPEIRYPSGLPLADLLAACYRQFSLQSVFTRDLVAAQSDGLLSLTGLETPGELEGCVLPTTPAWHSGEGLLEALETARRSLGRYIVFDGPEHFVDDPDMFARELGRGLRVTGLTAVLNLNAATPPPWADDLAHGPLFAQAEPVHRPGAAACLASLVSTDRVRIDWHLSDSDFAPDKQHLLESVVRHALAGVPIAFTFDRPRRPVALAEGVDRNHPAVLTTIALHLPRLAELAGDPERFVQKLGSLVRLALSAGVQKRAFLRRRERERTALVPEGPAITRGFLLDRARLIVAPVGLDAVVRTFTGHGLAAGGAALDLGRSIVRRLRAVATEDGGRIPLQTCIDGPADFRLDSALGVVGLTPWEPAATVREQLRGAAAVHAEAGTLALFIPPDASPADAVDWLRTAWQRPEIVRLRFMLTESSTSEK
jgi:hypothetical protein